MLANTSCTSTIPSSEPFSCLENGNINKRKRRPAGTPDPDAEVVSLSPKTLLESDRYICEICNQGFQRDQNLQMHRRRHKVPWKLLKRETPVVRKRVFVCPEPSCLHHDPCHALGDLVGIKKHFRRKHSNQKQWVCEKCSKGYAVQSDYKAHLKTCGTRGHSCDCGRVFSRVESFIEHQDACHMGRVRPESQAALQPGVCLSRTTSSPSQSSETNFSATPWSSLMLHQKQTPMHHSMLFHPTNNNNSPTNSQYNKFELRLLTTPPNVPNNRNNTDLDNDDHDHSTQLNLSIGSSEYSESSKESGKEDTREQMKLAMTEKAYAEKARQEAKWQIEMAEQEFANAKRIRQQALAEVNKARALKDEAIKQINSTILEITCHACKQRFQASAILAADDNSLVSSSKSKSSVCYGGIDNN